MAHNQVGEILVIECLECLDDIAVVNAERNAYLLAAADAAGHLLEHHFLNWTRTVDGRDIRHSLRTITNSLNNCVVFHRS